jgi:hypothetical protein
VLDPTDDARVAEIRSRLVKVELPDFDAIRETTEQLAIVSDELYRISKRFHQDTIQNPDPD